MQGFFPSFVNLNEIFFVRFLYIYNENLIKRYAKIQFYSHHCTCLYTGSKIDM